jgi:hypothetical protein
MVMDVIEAAGGLVTGGLIAKLLSRRENRRTESAEEHDGVCSDCGAAATGKFCSECGQPTHVHRSLLHLGEEMLHGVLHFDARIWRTLPLLAINPGRLTREWVQGKRTRYVSPLAMFLFSVFLMFFVFSFSGALEPKITTPLPERIAGATSELDASRAELSRAEAVAAASPDSEALAMTAEAVRTRVGVHERRLAALTGTGGDAARPDGLAPGSWQAEMADAVEEDRVQIRGDSKWVEKVRHKLRNPDLLLYKIQQTAYKFSFLLIPISIPFVALLFLWRRGVTLYDHGVFVLYSLTAMSVLMMTTSILGAIWSGFGLLGGLAIIFGVPAHMFAQLKGAYQLSWFSAAWRTVLLLIFCFFALTGFLLGIIMLGLAG